MRNEFHFCEIDLRERQGTRVLPFLAGQAVPFARTSPDAPSWLPDELRRMEKPLPIYGKRRTRNAEISAVRHDDLESICEILRGQPEEGSQSVSRDIPPINPLQPSEELADLFRGWWFLLCQFCLQKERVSVSNPSVLRRLCKPFAYKTTTRGFLRSSRVRVRIPALVLGDMSIWLDVAARWGVLLVGYRESNCNYKQRENGCGNVLAHYWMTPGVTKSGLSEVFSINLICQFCLYVSIGLLTLFASTSSLKAQKARYDFGVQTI